MKLFRGSRAKVVRRFGINIFENRKYDEILSKKSYPPGMHGPKRRRAKLSEYGKQLFEKQKLKFMYGMTERQFRNFYKIADKKKGPTGVILLQLLERRLDSFVFRAGFASSRAQARQLITHRHLLLNGKRADIPSMILNPEDTITAKSKERCKNLVTRYVEENSWRDNPSWISVDRDEPKAQVVRIPERDEIQVIVDEQLIVEHYSK